MRTLVIDCADKTAEDLVQQIITDGKQITFHRVDTLENLERAFQSGGWELILAGNNLPAGMSILEIVNLGQKLCPQVPFLYIPGPSACLKLSKTTAPPTYNSDSIVYPNLQADHLMSSAYLEANIPIIPSVLYRRLPLKNLPLIYISPIIEKMTGYAPQDFFQDQSLWIQLMHPEDRPRVMEEIDQSIARHISRSTEYRLIRKDGQIIWVWDRTELIRDEEGKRLFYQGLMDDITDRKTIEHRLLRRLAIDNLTTAISTRFLNTLPTTFEQLISDTLKEVGEFSAVDRCFLRWLLNDPLRLDKGYEWCREGIAPRIHRFVGLPVDPNSWSYQQIRQKNIIKISNLREMPAEKALDRQLWEEDGVQSLLLAPLIFQELPVGIIGFQFNHSVKIWEDEDITLISALGNILTSAFARKIGLDALQESEEHYRLISELVSDYTYFMVLDPEGKDTDRWRGGAFSRLTGYTPEEIDEIGGWEAIIYPKDEGVIQERINKLISNQAVTSEYRIISKDGKVHWLRDYSLPQWDEKEGRVVSFMGAAQDITRRKLIEVELYHANQELKKSVEERTKALRESENLYRTLVETSGDAIVLTDLEGKLLYCNRRTLEMVGYSQMEEMLGKNFSELLSEDSQALLLNNFSRVAQKNTVVNSECSLVLRNRSQIPVDISVSCVRDEMGNPKEFISIAHDIRQRKQTEAMMREYAERLGILQEIDRAILSAKSSASIAQAVLRLIQKLIPYQYASVMVFSRRSGEAISLATYFEGEINVTPPNPIHINDFKYTSGYNEGKLYIVEDLRENRDLSTFEMILLGQGVRSFISVPLVVRHELVGKLIFGFISQHAFHQQHVDIALQVASSLAVAVQQATTYEQATTRANEMEMLLNLSTALRQANTQNEMYTILTKTIKKFFGADCTSIHLMEDNILIAQAIACEGDIHPEEMRHLALSVFWQTLTANQLLVLSRTNVEDPEFLQISNLSTAVVVPIRITNAPIGLFCVAFSKVRDFSDQEKRLLTAALEMGENALNRAQVLNMLEIRIADRTRELQALYEIMMVVNDTSEIKQALKRSVEIIFPAIRSEIGAIYLLNDENENLHLSIQKGLPTNLLSLIDTLPLTIALKKNLLKNPRPMLLMDIEAGPSGSRALRKEGFLSYVMIPIRSRERFLGILLLFHKNICFLNYDEISLLSILTDQLGVTVENIRLRQLSERTAVLAERQRLSKDLHDSVTQALYSQTLFSEAGHDLLRKGDNQRLDQVLTTIGTNAYQALKEMRMLLYELGSPTLEEVGLVSALQSRFDSIERRVGIEASIHVKGKLNIPKASERELYFICNEALNNALKYARATQVCINIFMHRTMIELIIIDNGTGFDLEAVKLNGRMGVVNMKKRTESLGGQLDIISNPQKGTSIHVFIPR